MPTKMTTDERVEFLSGVHVGVMAIERPGRAPLAVPIWYAYAGDEVAIWTDRDSVKKRVLDAVGQFSFVVQTETRPYRYVTVEGPVSGVDDPASRAQVAAITARYLPADEVPAFLDEAFTEGSIIIRMRPERWLSFDEAKE